MDDKTIERLRQAKADRDVIARCRFWVADPADVVSYQDWREACAALLRALDGERADRRQEQRDFQRDARDSYSQGRQDQQEDDAYSRGY